MEIYITARDSHISDNMKEYLKDKINKIEKFSHKIVEVHATLDFQRYIYMVDVNVNTNLAKIHCEDNDADMFAAIDKVIDKLERQMQKIKEKVQNHHYKHNDLRLGVALSTFADHVAAEEKGEQVTGEEFNVEVMGLSEAIASLDKTHDSFLVFTNKDNNKLNVVCKSAGFIYELYERKNGSNTFVKSVLSVTKSGSGSVCVDFSDNTEFEIESVTVTQAVDKIKKLGKEFVVFFDTASSQFSMVYYMKDGQLGIVRANL